MTKLGVCFLTYTPSMEHPRVSYARHCLEMLHERLSFHQGEIHWHIADDGSPYEHVAYLKNLLTEEGVEEADITVSVSDRMGYGGNYNRATQVLHPLVDYVMPVEEDWELVRDFDVSGLVRALEAAPEDVGDPNYIGCIRLGYLGWTDFLHGYLTQLAGQTFLRFDSGSPEKHVWSGHPRIESVKYEVRVGAWPEGLQAGYTELEVGGRYEARVGVAWPLDAEINASQDYCRLFAHVGEQQA